jgi:iron complex transport system ATP-binding protein
LLQAADLRFAYASAPVLDGVALSVQPGDLVGLLGPNGSGKTTLIRLLSGTLEPQAGWVRLDGIDLSRIRRRSLARRMAVVPQETHPAFEYTVLEVALMGRYPHLGAFEIEGPEDLAIAREALDATGMLPFAHRPFSTLSGGEKQRVAIAAGLSQLGRPEPDGPPGVLLLDEPTASLDLGYQLEIAALLRRLHGARPLSIVISTHDLNFACGLCDRLVLLRDGVVLDTGPTADVLTPASIRRLYGVDAEVSVHAGSGRTLVVPLARSGDSAGGGRR